jgi:hypothetical protein
MGIFRYESAGLTVTLAAAADLCARGGCINAEAFFHGDGVRRGEPGMAGVYGGPQSVFQFCEGSARSLHEPVEFPVSAISFAVQLYHQQPAEKFSTTPDHFALEMATFAFKPQYTYVPNPPRSKSTATRRKPAPEQVSILDKLQQIRSSSTSLSTSRPVAAAAMAVADGDGDYRPGIRGML